MILINIAIDEINKNGPVESRAGAGVGEKAVSKSMRAFSETWTLQHRLGVMCRVLSKLYPHLALVCDTHTCTHTHTHRTPCNKILCHHRKLNFKTNCTNLDVALT